MLVVSASEALRFQELDVKIYGSRDVGPNGRFKGLQGIKGLALREAIQDQYVLRLARIGPKSRWPKRDEQEKRVSQQRAREEGCPLSTAGAWPGSATSGFFHKHPIRLLKR